MEWYLQKILHPSEFMVCTNSVNCWSWTIINVLFLELDGWALFLHRFIEGEKLLTTSWCAHSPGTKCSQGTFPWLSVSPLQAASWGEVCCRHNEDRQLFLWEAPDQYSLSYNTLLTDKKLRHRKLNRDQINIHTQTTAPGTMPQDMESTTLSPPWIGSKPWFSGFSFICFLHYN